nr:MAG: hypothetical protein [White spot syndrome virus]
MRGYTLLFSLENFTLPPSQKLFKNSLGSLQFRGWTASSTECQVPRVDLWVGPMSDYTRNVIAPEIEEVSYGHFWTRCFWTKILLDGNPLPLPPPFKKGPRVYNDCTTPHSNHHNHHHHHGRTSILQQTLSRKWSSLL